MARYLHAAAALRPATAGRERAADHLLLQRGDLNQPEVKGLTIMVNSIYNGWRMEDVWLDQ